jgi:hypothetical protein
MRYHEIISEFETIASATKANGEIDRKKANKMVDPKGYFKPKAPITELAGVKQHLAVLKNPRNISEYMKKFGYKEIGSGEYSYVFAKDGNDKVLKIYNDPQYDRFINFCKKHPENKFLPKFRGSPAKLTDNAKMIRIERLEPITYQEFANNKIKTLTNIAKNGFNEYELWDLTEEQKELLDTIRQIVGKAGPTTFIDIHPANVMKRGNTPVIIDPYADTDQDGWGSLPWDDE